MSRKVLFFGMAALMIALGGVRFPVFSEQSDDWRRKVIEGPYEPLATVAWEEVSFTSVTQEEAFKVILETGINPEEIVYFDIAPYDVTGYEDFEATWAAVVLEEDEPLGTFVHALSGELLATLDPLHEGLEAHLIDLGLIGDFGGGEELSGRGGSDQQNGVGQYESYPWGYDLPTPFGNHRLNCGYGCGYHTGANHYAVDLDMRHNECVPAPGSGWVMMAGDRGDGYGKQVIIQAGPTGIGNNYVYRVAHLNSTNVIPGWWANKNRTLGGAGCTGNCTGTHVHFSIHRGYYSGGRIYGGSVPLDRWPGPNDRVDYFDRYQTNQFSFNVCR